jgi:hypothetical protein
MKVLIVIIFIFSLPFVYLNVLHWWITKTIYFVANICGLNQATSNLTFLNNFIQFWALIVHYQFIYKFLLLSFRKFLIFFVLKFLKYILLRLCNILNFLGYLIHLNFNVLLLFLWLNNILLIFLFFFFLFKVLFKNKWTDFLIFFFLFFIIIY